MLFGFHIFVFKIQLICVEASKNIVVNKERERERERNEARWKSLYCKLRVLYVVFLIVYQHNIYILPQFLLKNEFK